MKKFIFLFILSFILLPVNAQQQVKVGYFSYDKVLKALPEYVIAKANTESLSKQYDTEMQNAQMEFNEKYENFLENQSGMADAIREKRQSELQSMLERNVAFKQESARLLSKAEEDAMQPLHNKIAEALKAIGSEKEFIMIVNTDSDACPYINPMMSEDITSLIIEKAK